MKQLALFEKISLFTLSIFYMFLCGAIYVFTYWGQFDVDVTNFISLNEIPKNLANSYPLLTVLFILALFALWTSEGNVHKETQAEITVQTRKLVRLIIL